jgi:hypothetical protein
VIYEVCCSDGLRWHDTHTKSHDDRSGHLTITKGNYLNNFRSYSVGITDERDL